MKFNLYGGSLIWLRRDLRIMENDLVKNALSKNKKLEIYSDLPKALLSNYKFFDGLTGGQLLILSSYDENNSNISLSIENFKLPKFKVSRFPGSKKLNN